MNGKLYMLLAITCRLNEPFPNGKVLNPKMNYGIGQTIRFECKDSNYEMDGPDQLECLDDGTWSDMLPTCMKKLTCADVPRYEFSKHTTIKQLICLNIN